MSYGLGAGGILGCKKALDILHTELDMTMALCGHRNLKKSIKVFKNVKKPSLFVQNLKVIFNDIISNR